MNIKETSKRQKNSKRIAVAIFVLILVVGLIVGIFFYINNNQPVSDEMREQQHFDTQNKQNLIEDTDKTGKDSPGTTTVPNNTDNIIISASQEANGAVTVTTQLIGYSDGTCELVVTNAGKSHTATVPVIFQPQYSTCAGFSIKKTDLGIGNWQITLTVNSKGGSLTKTTSLDVI